MMKVKIRAHKHTKLKKLNFATVVYPQLSSQLLEYAKLNRNVMRKRIYSR